MRRAALALLCLGLLASCDRKEFYRNQEDAKRHPQGTPSDRTGGAKNTPDNAGGGPGATTTPADQKK